MHSAYNQHADLSVIESAIDVQWLSDALHNFDQFGSALANNNAAHLAAACEHHISLFKTHVKETRHPYSPGATFKRSGRYFDGKGLDLASMIEVLESLRMKALAQASEGRERASPVSA